MEQKTFIEASRIYSIHTEENFFFLQLLLLKVSESFRFGQSKKNLECPLVYMSLLCFYREETTK